MNWTSKKRKALAASRALKGCDCVATKSVLKNIDVKTPVAARALVNALENAKGKHARPVINNRSFSDASREEIRKMFKVKE